MNVDISTLNRKMTKSIINQMQRATNQALIEGKVLGMVVNVHKDCHQAAIIEYNKDYFYLPMNWQRSSNEDFTEIYRKIGKWSSSKKFNTIEELNRWWNAYLLCCAKAMETHIYV